ncbi:MAG: methionine ABC transporter permease [Limnochordia bacterium]|jgi:D-methionine transport system permease protein
MTEFIQSLFTPMLTQLLLQGLLETLYMVGVSLVLAYVFGLPLGVILVVTEPDHLWPNKVINRILSAVVNIGRSLPFIILMVAIIPFTRAIVGTSIGTTAAIVPLTVAAVPFVARMVQSSLKEVDHGVIDAALAMGASSWQTIMRALLPEALPSLFLGAAVTAVNLVGYSAMAGAIGGGGLGDLAIRFGYQRFQTNVMVMTVLVLIILVQAMQLIGEWVAHRLDHRSR